MNNKKPIPKFSCKLERGNLSLEISAEHNIIVSRQHFVDNRQAVKAAQISAQQMMQKGWKLVMLNEQKVKQSKLVIPTSLAVSKIENSPPYIKARLPLGDGTVGREI